MVFLNKHFAPSIFGEYNWTGRQCFTAGYFFLLLSSADFFKISILKIIIQEHYQSVKQFGSKSGPTFCRSRFGSKQVAKIIIR